jgi:RNA polymerase sigma-70 factor (ECF subfamily)
MTQTAELLLRWAQGDPQALADLVQQDGSWIENHVRRRLGPLLRRRADTQDVVQNTLLEVLRCGPRFVCADRGHLRALLAKMVENVLRAQAAHDQAGMRDVRREVRPAVRTDSGSVLILDARSAAVTRPSLAAERSETRDWVRLALELLDPEDRNIVQWREQDELSFAEIANRLGVAEDAARMRFNRALPKLARKLKALRAGNLESVLGSDD